MAIQCEQCHGGPAYLEPIVETLQEGLTLQTVRCIRCGWRVSRQRPPRQHLSPDRPGDSPGLIGRPKSAPGHAAAVRASLEKRKTPCEFPGCSGHHYGSELGLCEACRRPLISWRHAKADTPPPLALVNGVWVRRGDPLPGIPGKRPAPPVADEIAAAPAVQREDAKTVSPAPRPRRAAKRQPKVQSRPPSPSKSLVECELSKLASRGNRAARELLSRLGD